jgi:hypothetical protein
MQPEELLGEDSKSGVAVPQFQHLALRLEVGVVGGIDCLGDSEDAVCDGEATAEFGGVFDVVDSAGNVRLPE